MPTQKTVRLNILSDLHLSSQGLPIPETDADIIILAGDIARPQAALEWARGFDKPVLYIAGNHEFYGASLGTTLQTLHEQAKGSSIHILDNSQITFQGVRFLGSTLWSDFNLYGPGRVREQAITDAQAFIRDFSRITNNDSPARPFSPSDMEALFNANRTWLQDQLAQPFDGPTVVITHHAPSPKSIHPRFEGSLINNCFVSNSEYLLDGSRAVLWIHGHTHDSFDYQVNGTRVVCNPRGYAKDGINENAAFDPNLVIEVAIP